MYINIKTAQNVEFVIFCVTVRVADKFHFILLFTIEIVNSHYLR